MKWKLNKKYIYTILVVSVVVIFLAQIKEPVNVIEGKWDISEGVIANNYEEYLKEEVDFDYNTPSIYNMAKEIKSRSDSPEEAIKLTIRTVVDTIEYSSKISIDYCYDEKASTVVEVGYSDCVGMARLVTSLLRAQGIPARTVGGCLSLNKRCIPIFSAVPYMEPQVTKMIEGDFKKRGYLHEWVEAWDGIEWKLIEPTSGQIYDLSCADGGQYLTYGYDSNQYTRCVIQSESFWNQCRSY